MDTTIQSIDAREKLAQIKNSIPGLKVLGSYERAWLPRDLVRDLIARAEAKPLWVLVTAEPVTDVDTTAADMLVNLDLELNAADIHLAFAGLKDPVKEKIMRYSLLDTIDEQHFYPTIDVAIAAFFDERARAEQRSSSPT